MKRFDRHRRCKRQVAVVAAAVCLACAAARGQTTAPAKTVPAKALPAKAPPTTQETTIAITRPGTFEIHVQGADLRGVLQLLSTQGKRNIIATKDVEGTVTADLYGVTFEQALKAVLASSGFDYIDEDGFIYVHTAEQKAAIVKSKIQSVVRVFHLSYINAADAQVLIAPALSEAGSAAVTPVAASGIAASKTDSGGNALASKDMLVVRDTPKRLDRIAELLKEIDVKPEQVMIEATILSAELKEHTSWASTSTPWRAWTSRTPATRGTRAARRGSSPRTSPRPRGAA